MSGPAPAIAQALDAYNLQTLLRCRPMIRVILEHHDSLNATIMTIDGARTRAEAFAWIGGRAAA
ncbi:MAG: hypothetical protein NXI12_13750 [Alphaproteobacteria bacterium]|nr:hypothetical protein [Alphaproteobacteria bacterium]